MITAITGMLTRVLDDEARLRIGAIEYQVLVPEYVRRQLQTRIGDELTLHTTQYLEGNSMSNRLIPRLIGFALEEDLEFFELLCTVDKIGVRKALKALARPPKEVADAVQREDAKWLSTLPGIGKATAETVVTTLKRKVTKFALSAPVAVGTSADGHKHSVVIEDAYRALLSVGHNPADARTRLDAALAGGKTYKTVEEILIAVYSKGGGTLMTPITVMIDDETKRVLMRAAEELGVGIDHLASTVIADYVRQKRFRAILDYEIAKNKELYRRLAEGPDSTQAQS